MKVPYNYLPYEFCDVEKIIDEWRVLIKTTEFTIGRYVTSFENKFASYLGVSHCIATNNGTDALILCHCGKCVGVGEDWRVGKNVWCYNCRMWCYCRIENPE